MYSPLINFKVKPGSQVQCQPLLLSMSILLAVLDDQQIIKLYDGVVVNYSIGWDHRPGRAGTNGHSTGQSDGGHCDSCVVIYLEEGQGD